MIIPNFFRRNTSTAETSNSSVWCYWNKDYTSTGAYLTTTNSSVTCADNSTVWKIWNSDHTGVTSWISDSTDPFFISGTAANDVTDIQVWQEWNVPQEAREATRRASAEQREAWHRMEAEQRRLQEAEQRQRREEIERQMIKQAEERKAADKRAEELLRSCLTPQQQEELDRLNHFHLIVGDRRYRIKRGRTRNIELLDESGRPVKKLCAHPGEYVPDADTMLAQKLMLETDEEAFLKLANHTPVHYPPEPPTVRPNEQVARAV